MMGLASCVVQCNPVMPPFDALPYFTFEALQVFVVSNLPTSCVLILEGLLKLYFGEEEGLVTYYYSNIISC